MANRDNFYTAVAYQRGGVPLAQLPVRRFQVSQPGMASFQSGYANNPGELGWTPDYIPGFGYTKTGLQNRGANVSTYDHNAIVKTLLAGRIGASDIEAYPGYVQFVAVASNDSAALLKTAYWLAVAADATGSETLRLAAQQRNDAGLTAGVDIGAASRNSNIKGTYESAYRLLQKIVPAGSTGVAADALEELRKGTDIKKIEARVEDAQKTAAARKEQEAQINKAAAETPCEQSARGLIPGYCQWKQTSETAAKVVETATLGLGLTLGLYIGYKLYQGVTGKNTRNNPVSTEYDPDAKAPIPAAARRQEARLARTVFVRERA